MVSDQCTDNKQIVYHFSDDAFNVISSVWSGFNIFGKGTGKAIDFTYDTEKIGKQMSKRGWNNDLIAKTLSNPARIVETRDTRWLPGAEGPLDVPATAYIRNDGTYVVRNNKTGEIVQLSDRNNPNWITPWD